MTACIGLRSKTDRHLQPNARRVNRHFDRCPLMILSPSELKTTCRFA